MYRPVAPNQRKNWCIRLNAMIRCSVWWAGVEGERARADLVQDDERQQEDQRRQRQLRPLQVPARQLTEALPWRSLPARWRHDSMLTSAFTTLIAAINKLDGAFSAQIAKPSKPQVLISLCEAEWQRRLEYQS